MKIEDKHSIKKYILKFIIFLFNSIKIVHKPKKYSTKKEICIFGVLCNDRGLKIEKSLLNWLLPEYDVYCVYQKYPGKLYEYPALRFSQWFSQTKNISIILYIHTKGAFHSSITQDIIREIWKHEFTKPKKGIYISLLKNNYTDIALPFRYGISTWFNGMFISLNAFNLINEIEFIKNRWHYEGLFRKKNKSCNRIRIKGVLNDNISALKVASEIYKYLNNFKKVEIKKEKKTINRKIASLISVFLFVIYLKIKILKENFL